MGPVEDHMANLVVAQMLFLGQNPDEDIHLYINSQGGSVTAGMSIYNDAVYSPRREHLVRWPSG